jgi:membrane-associated protein
MIASVQSWLLHLQGPVVYAAVGMLVFFEAAILIGFVVPGEIAAIIGGVIASQRHANIVIMIIVVAATASLGNVVGYELGRLIGPWLMRHRPLRGSAGVARTEKLIARRGAPAGFWGRWIAVVRAIVPGVAGLSQMDRRKFVVFATSAAVLWAATWVLVGFAAGNSYTKLVHSAGRWSLLVVAVVVVVVVGLLVGREVRVRRRTAS